MLVLEILEFLKNNWLIALIALIVVVLLLRAMFKVAIVALIIGCVLIFAFGYTPDEVWNLGKNALSGATSMYEQTVKPVLEKELEGAEYVINPDGSFVVKTENVELTGTKQSEVVTIRYKEQEFELNISALGSVIKEQISVIQSQIPTE